jgi:hypothetical protein
MALLKTCNVRDDPVFTIPKLGQHYSEKWGEGDDLKVIGSALPPSLLLNGDWKGASLERVGDVTARLLSALIR